MSTAQPLIIAHRGSSKEAPENTMAAFRLALEQGCDAIELDIHLSADRRVIVCHDATIDRTTNGTGAIMEMTAEQLRQYDAGSWFGESFAGERLPLLDEVLDLVPASIGINIEIKSHQNPHVIETVIELLESRKRLDSVFFSSFGHECMVRLKQAAPAARVGLLYNNDADEAAECLSYFSNQKVSGYSLHPHHACVDGAYVQAAKAQGLQIYPWTVDEPERLTALIRSGASGIITNRPQQMRELLADAVV